MLAAKKNTQETAILNSLKYTKEDSMMRHCSALLNTVLTMSPFMIPKCISKALVAENGINQKLPDIMLMLCM